MVNVYNLNGNAVASTLARAIHKEMVASEEEFRPVDVDRAAWLECHAAEEAAWTLLGDGRWDHALPHFRGRHLPRRQRFDAVAFDEAAG